MNNDEQPTLLTPPKGIKSLDKTLELFFEDGTLLIQGLDPDSWRDVLIPWDERVQRHRASAHDYRIVLAKLLRAGYSIEDHARAYEPCALALSQRHEPYDHQAGAIQAWKDAGMRAVVVLPTGSGKTFVAQLAMEEAGRSTMVIVPTIDLLNQWSGILEKAFDQEIGLLGGGYHEIKHITVSTYDSACLHMDRLGDRFGLLIFDEVHHLPGELYQQAALASIAPYRLGLTATYERSDGKEKVLDKLVGNVAFRKSIKELSGHVLADYQVHTLEVPMTEEDQQSYEKAREHYRGFVSSKGIRMSSVDGWKRFLAETSRSEEGREAFKAYHTQKKLALVHQAKLDRLYELCNQHHDDLVLIFTNDNDSVYEISERMLSPAITHQTPIKERKEILERFNEGSYRTIVTSKVLNEGVDVPEARVAIILSGSGSVREHVQRLGRILRRSEDKKAILYELVTVNTVETYVSQRRREHDAYQ